MRWEAAEAAHLNFYATSVMAANRDVEEHDRITVGQARNAAHARHCRGQHADAPATRTRAAPRDHETTAGTRARE
jgi:hypothetical protein